MRDSRELVGGGAKGHGDDDLMDELGDFGADRGGPKDALGTLRDDQFYKAIGLAADHRFAVIVEGRAGLDDGEILIDGFAQRETDRRDLWIGKDGEELERVVDAREVLILSVNDAGGVSCCDLGLLDGDVHDLERPADVARSKDMFRGGLLMVVDADSSILGGLDSGGGESEIFRKWTPTQRIDNFLGVDRAFAAELFVAYPLQGPCASRWR